MHKKWIYNRFAMYTNPAARGRTSGDNESSSICPLCAHDLSGTAADEAGALLALSDEAIAMEKDAAAAHALAHGAGAGLALARIRNTSPRISTPYKHLLRQRPRPRTGLALTRLEPIVQTYHLPATQPPPPRAILQPPPSYGNNQNEGEGHGQGQLRVRIAVPEDNVAGSLSLESGKGAPLFIDGGGHPEEGGGSYVDEHNGEVGGTMLKSSTPFAVIATTHEPLGP